MLSLLPHPRTLFVSPRNPSHSLSKNALSFFLRKMVIHSGALSSNPSPLVRPRAHSIQGVATSAALLRNYSVSRVLESATWKSASVFTSFYLRDVQLSSEAGFSLGPFVAASSMVLFLKYH